MKIDTRKAVSATESIPDVLIVKERVLVTRETKIPLNDAPSASIGNIIDRMISEAFDRKEILDEITVQLPRSMFE